MRTHLVELAGDMPSESHATRSDLLHGRDHLSRIGVAQLIEKLLDGTFSARGPIETPPSTWRRAHWSTVTSHKGKDRGKDKNPNRRQRRLLGLIDLCLEGSTAPGAAPTMVTTGQLAEKVVELYWPHAAPYAGVVVLRQSSAGTQAEIISSIRRFRERHAPDPSAIISDARLAAPARFRQLLRTVEWKLVEMPLPKLQRVGLTLDPFIYRIGWDDHIRRTELEHESFDNRILFVGEAADHLVRLAGLLRPLIQRHWTAMVSKLNREAVPDTELEEFLFGASRIPTERIRADVRELQDGRCFYCDRTLRGPSDVDHFMPWSRYPDNGLTNLVVADQRCNNSKRHFLAASEHVEKWADRFDPAGTTAGQLAEIATRVGWDHRPERTLGVARSIYLRLPTEAKLWLQGRTFVDADTAALSRTLAPSSVRGP